MIYKHDKMEMYTFQTWNYNRNGNIATAEGIYTNYVVMVCHGDVIVVKCEWAQMGLQIDDINADWTYHWRCGS